MDGARDPSACTEACDGGASRLAKTATRHGCPRGVRGTPGRDRLLHPGPPAPAVPTRRALFEKFRAEVFALDPDITEHFLKKYVAYKAETNFVDVVPQVARMRLSLNCAFESLHDERGLAWDVTGKGHWGNGNVEVGLDEESDFAYVMGLVRQAYEFQMGE